MREVHATGVKSGWSTRAHSTSPPGRGRREAAGEEGATSTNIRRYRTSVTRSAKALRPLPGGEVKVARPRAHNLTHRGVRADATALPLPPGEGEHPPPRQPHIRGFQP